MVETQIFKWKCPKCGKQIIDVSKGRFEWNIDTHKRKCKNEAD